MVNKKITKFSQYICQPKLSPTQNVIFFLIKKKNSEHKLKLFRIYIFYTFLKLLILIPIKIFFYCDQLYTFCLVPMENE